MYDRSATRDPSVASTTASSSRTNRDLLARRISELQAGMMRERVQREADRRRSEAEIQTDMLRAREQLHQMQQRFVRVSAEAGAEEGEWHAAVTTGLEAAEAQLAHVWDARCDALLEAVAVVERRVATLEQKLRAQDNNLTADAQLERLRVEYTNASAAAAHDAAMDANAFAAQLRETIDPLAQRMGVVTRRVDAEAEATMHLDESATALAARLFASGSARIEPQCKVIASALKDVAVAVDVERQAAAESMRELSAAASELQQQLAIALRKSTLPPA
jgi:hypothetical protein